MSKRRRRRTRISREDGPSPMPRYNFPGCGALLAVLVILAGMAFFGSIIASSDAVQTLAHGQVQATQP